MIIFIATFLFAKILMSSAGNNATYITCPTTTLADKCHDCIATSVSDLHRPALGKQQINLAKVLVCCAVYSAVINHLTTESSFSA